MFGSSKLIGISASPANRADAQLTRQFVGERATADVAASDLASEPRAGIGIVLDSFQDPLGLIPVLDRIASITCPNINKRPTVTILDRVEHQRPICLLNGITTVSYSRLETGITLLPRKLHQSLNHLADAILGILGRKRVQVRFVEPDNLLDGERRQILPIAQSLEILKLPLCRCGACVPELIRNFSPFDHGTLLWFIWSGMLRAERRTLDSQLLLLRFLNLKVQIDFAAVDVEVAEVTDVPALDDVECLVFIFSLEISHSLNDDRVCDYELLVSHDQIPSEGLHPPRR